MGVTGVVLLLFDVAVVATGVVVAASDNDVVDVDSTRALSRYASVREKKNKIFNSTVFQKKTNQIRVLTPVVDDAR